MSDSTSMNQIRQWTREIVDEIDNANYDALRRRLRVDPSTLDSVYWIVLLRNCIVVQHLIGAEWYYFLGRCAAIYHQRGENPQDKLFGMLGVKKCTYCQHETTVHPILGNGLCCSLTNSWLRVWEKGFSFNEDGTTNYVRPALEDPESRNDQDGLV